MYKCRIFNACAYFFLRVEKYFVNPLPKKQVNGPYIKQNTFMILVNVKRKDILILIILTMSLIF